MKRLMALAMTVMFAFALASAASAAGEYIGYYASTGYDEAGKGPILDNAHGLPAKYVAHVELRADRTYEGLIFGGLISGVWHVMKNQKGTEFVGLKVIETVDKKHYPQGTLFMLARNPREDNSFWLMQTDADEQMSMEKRPGKFDFDKVVGEIEKHYSGEK